MDARDRQNLAVAALVIALIGAVYWAITGIAANARLEECLQQRRRNCEMYAR